MNRPNSLQEPPAPLPQAPRPKPPSQGIRPDLQAILDALRGIRFGSVEITVQDDRIVQIQRSEKYRLV